MINIIYEDNHLLVVEKPINMPSQKDMSNDIDLLTTLKDYLKNKYNKTGNVYLGLVQRLDRPTGGIMVLAKTSKAAKRLSEDIQNHKIKKIYNAIVEGNLKENDTFIDYLIKDEKTNISKITTKEKGKESVLHYEIIKKINNFNLIKIELETGRSHQIRVQFAYRDIPLFGDQKYNRNCIKNTQLSLYSTELSFIHPVTKEELYFKISLPNTYPWNLFK